MVHHSVGNPPGVFRPPRSSLREVLRNLDIRPVKAKQILVREGRAMGVLLESGEELAASSIVSGASPRRTLTELVDPAWLDPELVRAVRNIRARGVVARVTLTLERAPDFFVLTIAPSLDYLERAYDDSKYGRVSSQPWLEARCEGRRVEIDVQYVPRAEAKLAELAANELSRHVPGMTVMESSVTLAADGLAELSLDQAFWGRPTAALAHYRTPIQGLWLCGPDMHPGPGIAGAAGYNCVREMLRG
jgi:phytoene dehydrogenase-like protein